MTTLRWYRLSRMRRRRSSTWLGIAEAEGWDQTELMYFVFEFGTKKGMQYCREYYEMKNSARQVVPQGVEQEEEEVFDLVGVAEAEGWDQTELMFFVFEYENSRQEVRQVVCPESTKEAKVRFLFRESGRLGVQVVDGGLTLEEWFAGREGESLGAGVDGYFTTLGVKMFNPRVEISRLGSGGLQEVVFHGRSKGGACNGAGRVDSPNVGEWQCSFCMAPHCWHTKMACYKCGTSRYWESGVLGQGGLGGLAGKGGGFGGGGSGKAAGFFGQGGVASATGGTRIIGPTGRDQAYVPRGEPTFRKGNGAKGGGEGGVDTGAGVGGRFLSEVVGGSRGEAVGRSGGSGQVPPGPPPSQRDQAVSALRASVELLDPVVGAQVWGLVEGLLPPKPASPGPATTTHAQIVARLHGLCGSETKLIRKVDEVEGRVEKAKAKVVEEEAALAGVQGRVARFQRSNFGCPSGVG